jgi:TonB family protein
VPEVANVRAVAEDVRATEPERRACRSVEDECDFDEMDREYVDAYHTRASQDQARAISLWLAAVHPSSGTFHDVECTRSFRPGCSTLCRAELGGIAADSLRRVVERKRVFEVRRSQLEDFSDAVTSEGPAEEPVLLLRGGPVKVGSSGRPALYVEIERHPCIGATAARAVDAQKATTITTPPRLAAPIACTFPPEAKVDGGRARVRVSVDASGATTRVLLLADPGHGLGRAAKECAAAAKFLPARDERGAPVAADLEIVIAFRR